MRVRALDGDSEMYWFVYVVIALVGLIQIPIFVDIFRALFPGWKLRRTTHRCVNILLIIAMCSFFIVGLSYYLLLFLPLTVNHPFTSVRGLVHLSFAVWVWINVVVNYFMAVLVHPGKAKENIVATGDKSITTNCEQASIQQNGMHWNPPRYHYCSVCQESMAYMDHHCPFTGNCAGLKNYSYFLLCLLYGALGLGYALWMSFPYFNRCVLANLWWLIGLAELDRPSVCSVLGPHVNIVLAVFGGFLITMMMSISQVLLLLADLSSYDILKYATKITVFRFAWHRMRGGKYKEPGSRLNVMLLQQRPNVLWFFIPCMNTNDDTPLSALTKQ